MPSSPSASPTTLLQAGVARVGIDPPLHIAHAGWGAQTHVHADGRHLPMVATVLVMAQGDRRVVVCDLDNGLVPTDTERALRQAVAEAAGTTPDQVRSSVSHTHAGPETWRSLMAGDAPVEAAYLANLVQLLKGAAVEAAGSLRPVRVALGEGRLQQAVNRRQVLEGGRVVVGCDWAAPTDPAVPVLRLEQEDGACLATLFGYAMHPTILGPENHLLSPDYPGFARRAVETLCGGKALFLQGCAGDQGPGPEGFSDDLSAAERAGTALGAEAAKVSVQSSASGREPVFERVWESGAPLGRWRLPPRPMATTPPLRALSRVAELPLKELPALAEVEAEAMASLRRRDQLRAAGAPAAEVEDATWRTKRAQMRWNQALTYGGQRTASVEVQGIAVGDAVLVGVPLEPFADVGLRVKARSPFALTHVSGYSNGWLGYLPNRRGYREGGYEVDATPFAEGADEVLVEAMVALVLDLHRQDATEGSEP